MVAAGILAGMKEKPKRGETITAKVSEQTKKEFLAIATELERTESWLADVFIAEGVARYKNKKKKKKKRR